MPEGHTLHRLARDLNRLLAGAPVRACSPQGRFASGAARLDGRVLERARAHGKHLFVAFDGDVHLHVHLGLYGAFELGAGAPPPVRGQVRLRLVTPEAWGDLRGVNRCALVTRDERAAVLAGLGPDPLARADHGDAAWARVASSRRSVAALLMDQSVVAGVGNVYRAEVLFRQGVDPFLEGRRLDRAVWDATWADLRALMRAGVRSGRIDTTRPEHRPRAMGRPPRRDRHGGDVYVYRRAGDACYVCGSEVRTTVLEGRNLFWCPGCQPPRAGRGG